MVRLIDADIPDALVASTARLSNATLSTTNTKHYPMNDVKVERPY